MSTEEFRRELRAARARAGVTQQQLADATGVSINTVGRYEAGTQKRPPGPGWIEAAEKVLGARLLEAAGYIRTEPVSHRRTLSYGGAELSPEAERQVLDYIDWIRSRSDPG